MLTPTHVQVAILHTKDLIIKGKNGTNDAFIIFGVGKQKFQSSIKEKVSDQLLEWNEGCDIPIPSADGNKSEVVLKVLHKASLGDKFLGRVVLPLLEFDVTAKPRPKWYPLKPKPGSEKDTKYRGEIEVKIAFLIKSTAVNGSTNELTSKVKKEGFRSSLGSILSLGKKKKKKDKDKTGYNSSSKESISSSIDSLRVTSSSSRVYLNNNLPVINDDPGVISEEDEDETPLEMKIDSSLKRSPASVSGSIPDTLNDSLSSLPTTPKLFQRSGLKDIFDDKDKHDQKTGGKDTLNVGPGPSPSSPRNTRNSLQPSPKPKKFQLPSVIVEEEATASSFVPEAYTAPPTPEPSPKKLTVSASMSNLMESSGKGNVRKTLKTMFSSSKHLSVDDVYHPTTSGNESSRGSVQSQQQQRSPGLLKRTPSLRDLKVPKETYKQYERKSKEELVAMIVNLQHSVDHQKQKIGDLEDYIDKLLLRVLDNMPSLLKNGSMRHEMK